LEGGEGVLSVCCCQHHENGNKNYNTKYCVTSIGAKSLRVPEVCAKIKGSTWFLGYTLAFQLTKSQIEHLLERDFY